MLTPEFLNALAINKNPEDPFSIIINQYDEGLTDSKLSDLIGALRTNHTVRSLELGSNHITSVGARKLADLLREPTIVLAELSLQSNLITTEGIVALARSLQNNITVTELNLMLTGMDDESSEAWLNPVGTALCEALQSNFTLTTLNYDRDKIRADQAKIIDEYLKRNQTLARELLEAAKSQNRWELERLLEQGVSPYSTYARVNGAENGRSTLHIAVEKNDGILARALLRTPGGKVLLYYLDETKETPLTMVLKPEYKNIARILVQALDSGYSPTDDTSAILNPSNLGSSPRTYLTTHQAHLNQKIEQKERELYILRKEKEELHTLLKQTDPRKDSRNEELKSLIEENENKIKELRSTVDDLKERQDQFQKQLEYIGQLTGIDSLFREDQELIEKNPKACHFYKALLLYLNSLYVGDLSINSGNVAPSHSWLSKAAKGTITIGKLAADIWGNPVTGLVVGGAANIINAGIDHIDENRSKAKSADRTRGNPDLGLAYKRNVYIVVLLTLALIKDIQEKDDKKPTGMKNTGKKLKNILISFNLADTEIEHYAKSKAAEVVNAIREKKNNSLTEVENFSIEICAAVFDISKDSTIEKVEQGRQHLKHLTAPAIAPIPPSVAAPTEHSPQDLLSAAGPHVVIRVLSQELSHVKEDTESLKGDVNSLKEIMTTFLSSAPLPNSSTSLLSTTPP